MGARQMWSVLHRSMWNSKFPLIVGTRLQTQTSFEFENVDMEGKIESFDVMGLVFVLQK